MSPMSLREKSTENIQVFCPWSSFKMSACTVPLMLRSTSAFILAFSSGVGSDSFSFRNLANCWPIAALKNMASIIGAGPLMVMETDVLEEQRSNPEYNSLTSSSVHTDTPEVPTLP